MQSPLGWLYYAHGVTHEMTDQGGRFRINWVAETTGIPEATLRAWERRYQVPKPARTPSGYRLYSPDDVAQVKRMRELCDNGISPADAAKEILLGHERVETTAAPEAAPVRPETPHEPAGAETRLAEAVAPEHTNSAGVLSLSRAVALLERAATVAASRAARSPCVVVSCGSVDLAVPVAIGRVLEASARLVASREGSLSVDVELSVEDVATGRKEHVTRATLVLVALDAPSP
jgi:acyl-CoA hydrolase